MNKYCNRLKWDCFTCNYRAEHRDDSLIRLWINKRGVDLTANLKNYVSVYTYIQYIFEHLQSILCIKGDCVWKWYKLRNVCRSNSHYSLYIIQLFTNQSLLNNPGNHIYNEQQHYIGYDMLLAAHLQINSGFYLSMRCLKASL